MDKAPFEFGQTVFVAWADPHHRELVDCPSCAGKRFVTITFGDGTSTSVECQECGAGWDGARGVVPEWRAASGVDETTVTGLRLSGDEWVIDTARSSYERVSDRKVFATREEAETRRVELMADAELQAEASRFQQHKWMREGKRSARSASYHRAELKKLREQIAWHEARLSERKTKARAMEGSE